MNERGSRAPKARDLQRTLKSQKLFLDRRYPCHQDQLCTEVRTLLTFSKLKMEMLGKMRYFDLFLQYRRNIENFETYLCSLDLLRFSSRLRYVEFLKPYLVRNVNLQPGAVLHNNYARKRERTLTHYHAMFVFQFEGVIKKCDQTLLGHKLAFFKLFKRC